MFNKPTTASIIWTLIASMIIHSPLAKADGNQTADLGIPPPPVCDKNVYGTPDIEDCKAAMGWIPYFNEPRGRQRNEATAFRTFAEPQFLKPPFSPVRNEWAPRAIVQLPKIWKHNSCTIAMVLQPYNGIYDTKKDFVKPVFKAKWADVGRYVDKLVPCLQPRGGGPPQGGYTVLALTNSYPAGIYLYTSDSAFNQVQMARYMGIGTMIAPPKGRYGTYVSAGNSSSEEGPQSDDGYSRFEVFNSTSMTSSTVALDVVEDATSRAIIQAS